jgi:hypothetical protein|tara:strand:- start:334 stop:579 length:246 start_codon:yes stop_codon:yes gene_type:complete
MAKKKKFGIMDAVELAESAAQAFSTFKAAQKTTADSKTAKKFDEGASTNLPGSEGGVSKKPTNQKRTPSQLNTDLIEKYRY